MTTTAPCLPTSPNAAPTLPARPETKRTTTTDLHQPTTPPAPHTLPARPETDRTTTTTPTTRPVRTPHPRRPTTRG